MTELPYHSSPTEPEVPEADPFTPANLIARNDGSMDYDSDSTTSSHRSQRNSHVSSLDCAVVEATRAETAAVRRSKLLVYAALILAATAVGTVTYILTSKEETENYKTDFNNYAREIARLTEGNVKATVGQVQSLSVMVTSIAKSNNLSWPNVSVPHFARRALEAEELAGIELLLFVPMVSQDQRGGWESYAWEHQGWIEDDLELVGHKGMAIGKIPKRIYAFTENSSVTDNYQYFDGFVPVWQVGPVPKNASVINLDLNRHPSFRRTISDVIATRHVMLSEVVDLNFLLRNTLLDHDLDDQPRSYILEPVFDDFNDVGDASVSGFFVADLQWGSFLIDLLPATANGMLVVVRGTCGDDFSYLINGPNATFLNSSDVHDSKFTQLEVVHEFAAFAGNDREEDSCHYSLSIFPTDEFVQPYQTNQPAVYTSVVVLIFCLTAAVFVLYDYFVHVRQEKLHSTAKRTNEIVASMFPKEFQKRVMDDAKAKENKNLRKYAPTDVPGDAIGEELLKSKPIANLYSDVTLMFADIVGFTAWSSVREPCEVFTLLETIFHEYDLIASQRKVFKVETVGDCYVAVAGLPEPRKDHAVIMARFARDCLLKFNIVVQELENILGPDTSELGMRFGLHSGPVTAGVLRGERSRFQLFGDTMNTAARIESTGAKNKIHLSEDIADRLSIQGRGHWCIPRPDKVVAKGKGELTTYWLELRGESAKSSRSGSSNDGDNEPCKGTSPHQVVHSDIYSHNSKATSSTSIAEKHERLVNWNTDILLRMLNDVIARRHETGAKPNEPAVRRQEKEYLHSERLVLDEVSEIIAMPDMGATTSEERLDTSNLPFSEAVSEQLRSYVTTIANLYRDNAFHSFEHASHVTMSTVKLLSRIVAPNNKSAQPDHTFGIASDPLTQFAIVFSALVHDVDHTGVPNAQLVREHASVASVYKNKSVAEQNSVDIAWDLLMHEQYRELRQVIYVNEEEFRRFRQILVNTVMATDIMDKDANVSRRERWDCTFHSASQAEGEARKASLVIEHLLQAADVAHSMQHWHIYRKWNARLFHEMHRAHRDGRAEKDPSQSWYEGEITFFDYFVIPLATKLKESGVFGASGDEYLHYAQQNRKEWESKGRQIVAEMLDEVSS